MIKKYKFHILGILILAGVGYFLFDFNQIKNISNDKSSGMITSTFKCPEDYANFEAYASDSMKFISDYSKEHPGATQEEIITVRRGLLYQHNCKGNGQTVGNPMAGASNKANISEPSP